ncbi:ATP-dependent DNA helicase Chl1 [Schizosaccharomyces japonicus yFS275]|uniref:ATP-dependent DNA helicase CHL1 n=1 Tax=Schizosaccharomyces japonicus (strain yFS275 / FY16936) TaxID=402676 RepID=B6JYI3_SCHJY|nr:ATP-dependent DNA helicase Chl1 [Schizosaccharomyces japonicus yFS275]EEB06601.2 ATP-dependent DNA helicase Chl1 [Schizosaccharomyces japonicus yFS275]
MTKRSLENVSDNDSNDLHPLASSDESLIVRKQNALKKFHHPYIPYSIQLDFMKTLFDVIENGNIGIFESPTGTGKSLSLLCGALTWLDERGSMGLCSQGETELQTGTTAVSDKKHGDTHADDDGLPDWVISQGAGLQKETVEQAHAELETRLEAIRKERCMKQSLSRRKRFRRGPGPTENSVKDSGLERSSASLEEDLLVQDDTFADGNMFTEDVSRLLRLLQPSDGTLPQVQKIYFASRTHSQLQQFLDEVRKLDMTTFTTPVRAISLASRKNLCINENVKRLGSAALINEKCIEIQGNCPFLQATTPIDDFRDAVLAEVMDMEDMITLGEQTQTCPYYGIREAIAPAHIVAVPYAMLLQQSTRDSLGISLRDNVCILDEAHNVIDSICSILSASVSQTEVLLCQKQLQCYLQRFAKRLSGPNRMHIQQLLRIVDELLHVFERLAGQEACTIDPATLFIAHGTDQINLHRLTQYISASKIARKANTFHVKNTLEAEDADHSRHAVPTGTPVIMKLATFLTAIANPSPEGRLFYRMESVEETVQGHNSKAVLEYALLDPSHEIAALAEQARSVILAGGTMSPMDEIAQLLFPSFLDRVKQFSCGHIVPESNICTVVLSKGTGGTPFRFTYKNRGDVNALQDLGRTMLNLTAVIPDGVVVFFCSFRHLSEAISCWKKSDLWLRLCKRKPIFYEDKEREALAGDGSKKSVFEDYCASVTAGKGGLLLSVINGRLSEGINFSDRLGRCVAVVGMPFPNAQDVRWQAKMSFVKEKMSSKTEKGIDLDYEFAENTCMRAANQSIGRAIRHKDDYACILLLDERYNKPSTQAKLPKWLANNITHAQSFGVAMRQIAQFFRGKKTN